MPARYSTGIKERSNGYARECWARGASLAINADAPSRKFFSQKA
jgi:hypothetical protein